MMRFWYGDGWFAGGWMLFMMLFWVVVAVVFLAWFMHRLRLGRGIPHGTFSPMALTDPREIVRMRYAKGEITKEQFDQMMQDLA